MKEKLYKFGKEKMNEADARKEADSTLDLLISVCDQILGITNMEKIKEIVAQGEERDFKLGFSKKYIEILNAGWDKGIAKEKEKNIAMCANNDIESFLKDVFASIDNSAKALKLNNKLLDSAIENVDIDIRYSAELIKFVDKVYKDSKEIFLIQKDYNQKYILDEIEAENE